MSNTFGDRSFNQNLRSNEKDDIGNDNSHFAAKQLHRKEHEESAKEAASRVYSTTSQHEHRRLFRTTDDIQALVKLLETLAWSDLLNLSMPKSRRKLFWVMVVPMKAESYPYAKTPIEMIRAMLYTLQLYCRH